MRREIGARSKRTEIAAQELHRAHSQARAWATESPNCTALMFSTRLFLVALLAVFGALTLAPAPCEGKITYIRPLWQPTSEWSPPEAREEPAELHSAAMKLYSEYVEKSGIQPCTYC